MISAEQIVEGIKKLTLNKGDVLVMSRETAAWFSSLPPAALDDFVKSVGFEVPVIVGDASKVSRADLVKMLENLPE